MSRFSHFFASVGVTKSKLDRIWSLDLINSAPKETSPSRRQSSLRPADSETTLKPRETRGNLEFLLQEPVLQVCL